mgnify:FL=1
MNEQFNVILPLKINSLKTQVWICGHLNDEKGTPTIVVFMDFEELYCKSYLISSFQFRAHEDSFIP